MRGATKRQHQRIQPRPFQSTRPCGARPMLALVLASSWVSIHAPMRGATCRTISGHLVCFNPRAHAGRDIKEHPSPYANNVSIHAPMRGATKISISRLSHNRFNPRAHAGRDEEMREFLTQKAVSIHAPMRGATHSSATSFVITDVSIHAPMRGATSTFKPSLCLLSFNPRAHAGRDARTRTRLGYVGRFNPRAHAGRDNCRCYGGLFQLFQSTRPCGARRSYAAVMSYRVCFNPRAHAGRDALLQ